MKATSTVTAHDLLDARIFRHGIMQSPISCLAVRDNHKTKHPQSLPHKSLIP